MGAPAAAPRPSRQYAGRPKLRKLPGSARNLKTAPPPRRLKPPTGAAAQRKHPTRRPQQRPKMNVYRSKSIGMAAGAGAAAIPVAAGRAAVRMSELPDSGLVVRLTQGRAWIGVLGTLLAGIVALNVLSLSFTAASGQVSVQVDQLERENSALRADIAEKLSSTKVQEAADSMGLATPAAEEIGYLGFNDSVFGKAARALAGGTLPSETPALVGSSDDSSSSSASTTSSYTPPTTSSSITTSTSTPSATSSTPTPSTSTPAPSSSSSSSSGGGGGVSAGL